MTKLECWIQFLKYNTLNLEEKCTCWHLLQSMQKNLREKKFSELTTFQISVLREHNVGFSWWWTRWPVGEMCLGLSILSASPSSMSTLSQVEQWPLHQPCMAPLSSSTLLPSGLGSVLTHGFPSSPHHRWCHQLAQEQNWQQAGHMGTMDRHQRLTQCLLSLLFSSLFISVLDLHSHQRTAPKAAEVTAKLRELPVFKSPLVQAGQVSSVLFSHWNVLCEGEVTGGLSQRSSVSAYLLMEISFPTPLFFFWVKVAYLFMTGSRGRRLHLVEKSMTQPWQIQPSVTGMVSCYLCLGFRNRFPATGERFR